MEFGIKCPQAGCIPTKMSTLYSHTYYKIVTKVASQVILYKFSLKLKAKLTIWFKFVQKLTVCGNFLETEKCPHFSTNMSEALLAHFKDFPCLHYGKVYDKKSRNEGNKISRDWNILQYFSIKLPYSKYGLMNIEMKYWKLLKITMLSREVLHKWFTQAAFAS